MNMDSISAWHGTVGGFNHFKAERIGSGEGMATFGAGLYFAEARAVAEFYRDKLSHEHRRNGYMGPVWYSVDGNPVEKGHPDYTPAKLAWMAKEYRSDIDDEAGGIEAWLESQSGSLYMAGAFYWSKWDAIEARFYELLESSVEYLQGYNGSLYRVSIAGGEDKLLDWDKPLSAQSVYVQAALSALEPAIGPVPFLKDWTGRQLYQCLAKIGGNDVYDGPSSQASTSTYLLENGIHGIRYLDGVSRDDNSPDGTRNYVVFDDSLITIEERIH
ncbi:hypothetical protein A3709_18955 [Halioglobus sp. HI00S01]|uniref:hypothetical protein n=1 Tax=Halioglobus sp. HI00S01 TaxID=1822214 RepID=UPI0007C3B9CC|nr:hypothetical protein [Halioglobus sp. HI00S01]KZX57704.1 hypothetical protein A3709_18955 [Halioglobus sp. HI00S01]